MRKAKLTVAAVALGTAVLFAIGAGVNQHSIAASANKGMDLTGYMSAGQVLQGSGYYSVLRLANASAVPANFNVLVGSSNTPIADPLTGKQKVTTVKVTVPPNGVTLIDAPKLFATSGATADRNGQATIFVQSDMAGKGAAVQTLLSNPDGGLTTLTQCVLDASVSYDSTLNKVLFGLTGPAFNIYTSVLSIVNPDSTPREIGRAHV